ncbi:MAG: hypothetical protein ETSY2_45080 [Candidatus Entotheonella gemina]|uniref:Uncharacterized protein n=1 Tax=Candidatus Entotheonella gemina TaxID=1429439 RepID=W4LIK0_9BACT|nr:MAG: hypothetical protein ETSY2_45080 [Candidatus Entotheonella gemina]
MSWEPKAIVVHNWPKLEETLDGRWRRRWNIVLQAPVSKSLVISKLEQELSTHENQVSIQIRGDCKVMMEVITERWGWDDDLYFYSYGLFKRVDEALGTILTIQGQKRDLWNPWLNEKLREEDEPKN